MVQHPDQAQPGVLSDPTTFAEYLTFVLLESPEEPATAEVMARLQDVITSLQHREREAGLTVTVGFSAKAWQRLFADWPVPAKLRLFPEMRDGPRHFPSTAGDIFAMVKSERMDLNFKAAKQLERALAGAARLTEDVQAFRYLDNRDMIDFVDGTENPTGDVRAESILVGGEDPDHAGGSYLTVQRYVHRRDLWEDQETAYQEQVVGRSKPDDIELEGAAKPVWAHNEKSKVVVGGEEQRMYRQNRPYGNALEQGTMFVGFVRSADTIETALKQMITADENGDYDRLLDFAEARSGTHYFVPPRRFLDSFAT